MEYTDVSRLESIRVNGKRGKYMPMRLVTWEEYREYVNRYKLVRVEDTMIPVGISHKIARYEPESFELDATTVWSFPERGDWATHKGDYRGNWAPQVARNLILRYSKPGELVLDQMCGSGTTLVECKLLGRNAIGVDINYEAVILTLDRLNFALPAGGVEPDIKVYHGDARNLNLIEDESIDLIATHPPYANIIRYSKGRGVEGDLSQACSLEEYLQGIREVAEECYRVLKPGRYCCILVGDTRKGRHYVPVAFRVMQQFLDVGFILKEDVIKVQWNTKKTGEKWARLAKSNENCWVGEQTGKRRNVDFFLITHEHLFVFRKPSSEKEYSSYKYSIKWW